MLEAEIPAQRIRALGLRIQEGDGVAEKRGLADRRRVRLQDRAARERIAEGGRRREVVVGARRHDRLLAEALLVDDRVRRVVAVLREVVDQDRRGEQAEARADDGFALQLLRRPGDADARAHQVRRILVGGALPVRVGQPTQHLETVGRELCDRLQLIGRDGGRRDRVRRVEGPAVFRASVLLVDRTIVVVAQAQVEREIALHAPIVLHESGEEVGIPGAERVDVEEALGGQPIEELRHVLAHGLGLRRAGILVDPPVAAEIVSAGRVSIGDGAQAVLAKVGAHFDAVVALELGPASVQLHRLRRARRRLVVAKRLECRARVEVDVGQRRPHRIRADVARKAERSGIETLARIRRALVHVRVVQPQIQNAGGADRVDLVHAAAPVFAAGDLAAGDVLEVVVLLAGQRIVTDVERDAARLLML